MILSRYKLIALLGILMLGVVRSEGLTSEFSLTNSLKGMKGVRAQISGVKNSKATHVTEEEVRTVVEVELRKAGIRIYTSRRCSSRQASSLMCSLDISLVFEYFHSIIGEKRLQSDRVFASIC